MGDNFMLKEKFEKTKIFIKEHKTEIALGAVAVGVTIFAGYKIKTYEDTIKATSEIIDGLKKNVSNLTCKLSIAESHEVDEMIRLDILYDICYESLKREQTDLLFQIEELKNYIANLDETKVINKFHRIPEKEARINELYKELQNIRFDEIRMEEIMKPIWED